MARPGPGLARAMISIVRSGHAGKGRNNPVLYSIRAVTGKLFLDRLKFLIPRQRPVTGGAGTGP